MRVSAFTRKTRPVAPTSATTMCCPGVNSMQAPAARRSASGVGAGGPWYGRGVGVGAGARDFFFFVVFPAAGAARKIAAARSAAVTGVTEGRRIGRRRIAPRRPGAAPALLQGERLARSRARTAAVRR